jgi:oligoribonuclease NrnB/cAMP/cGMP phosphodiesterase (DHH superfamily)
MDLIKIGTDPFQPGKFPLHKMLIDSDVDGIVSGAILKKVYPNIIHQFGDPGSIQDGKFVDFVDSETAVVDLPYVKGCGLYFDHHLSNKPSLEIVGRWSNTPSAARLVYDYYKNDFDLTNFTDILPDVDTFDSGAMKYEQVVNPSFVLKLALAIEKRDNQFFEYLMQILPNVKLAELESDVVIAAQIALYQAKIERIKSYVPNHITPRGKLVFVDLRDSDLADVHISIIESQLMDYEVVVNVKRFAGKTKFSLYQNNLLERPYEYDLLAIAKNINPMYSGGHKKGCGFAKPENKTVEECMEIIENQIAK